MLTAFLFAVLSAAPVDASRAHVSLGGDYWQHTEVAGNEVWGAADLHAHFFNYLAFGGRVLHGTPSAPGGMRQALASCGVNHGQDRGFSTAIVPEPRHRTSGYPDFEGWPRYDTVVHQQAYVDWIRRAWQGGVRLVQMDVQNTPILGRAYAMANGLTVRGPRTPVALDDAAALRLQTGAARLFFNDGPASDFAALAYSADEARRIIAAGKLAIVLGVEVEALDNLSKESQLSPNPQQAIEALADTLWSAGIRHVIPIHLTRNAFGQPAIFNPTLNAMNYADTGAFYAAHDGFDAGIRFDPRHGHADPLADFVGFISGFHGAQSFPPARAIAASEGLTPSGVLLVEAMLRRGFIVDVEHMSEQGVDQTLALAERAQVPVISSHTHFRDLSFGTRVTFADGGFVAEPLPYAFAEDVDGGYGTSDAMKVRSDRSRTRAQLDTLRRLGGMVGVQLVSNGVGISWRDQVAVNCDGTSKSFVQLLRYAQELLGETGHVAFASDVGGFAQLPAPRFGVDACAGARGDDLRGGHGQHEAQVAAQRHGVQYTSPLAPTGPRVVGMSEARWSAMREGPNAPLERSVAGHRVFDVNVDGVAHYGMLPDFFQDVANVTRAGGQPTAVPALFRSAEAFLLMWQRIERQSAQLRHP